ncbi:hypothetical protein VN24_15915 [Paenibacillus beijingensis]|uniref:Uncharacterized protein n=2 Tax=Paenibacillus beijingensis TaxID=1126833 RepID=A0A0D5NKJ2_9BACL|nr:hypothetical protein VN24_15915 [Paenibacillus beijingensis]
MITSINGLQDIHTVIRNERKVGGAVEAERIRLCSGEEYAYPVITSVDTDGKTIYSIGFFTNDGTRIIANISEVAQISQPSHKWLKDLVNTNYKSFKIGQKVNYLLRLCELNEGSATSIFRAEVERIVEDIGADSIAHVKNAHPILQHSAKILPMRIA